MSQKHTTDHTKRMRQITERVWRDAERSYRAKAALARRQGRHVLAAAYLKAAERAIERATGRLV